MLLISAISLASAGTCAAGVFIPAKLFASPPSPVEQLPSTCAVMVQRAVIGNTQGKGALLRATPSTASSKLPLPDGTAVRITGATRLSERIVWSEIEVMPLGRTGWVATKYLVEPK